MAKTNKYTSINFNDIFEKKKSNPNTNTNTTTNKPSSSSSTHSLYNKTSRNQNGMLVLTRPTPKPLQQPQTPKSDPKQPPRSEPNNPTISLRPLGQTGSSSSSSSYPSSTVVQQVREVPVPLKPEPFVPPHLRPGFVGKEEKFGQTVQGNRSHENNGRPKSGGGYETRMRRGGESDPGILNRPSSSGGGGWYGPSRHF